MLLGIDREELAWAAGFFDGEGSIGHYPRPDCVGRVLLQVAQVDPFTLHRFAAAVGYGRVTGPYKTTNGRPAHRYSIQSFERVQQAIASMWPWLSEPKREQARRALLAARAERVSTRRAAA